ncbi:MAG: ABC transporter substrate-binding protein [Oscillospiraceae bacterium]|jgi:putative aldouronate transport system substrate-binding protein|nr:ABC transporter substrate-binding protein [Oscillospiraceae bacterium]
MKKILRIAALLLALTLVLAACSSPSPSSGGGGTVTPGGGGGSENPPDDSAFKAVTLKMYTVGDAQPAIDRINKAASDYLHSIGKPYSIEMNMEGWPSGYSDVVNLMLGTGEKFDLCFTANWAASFYENAPKGYFTNLTPYLAKYPDIEKTLSADFMNATLIDGKNFALPCNKEKARQLGWVLRKDIVDAMGMDISKIKSLADLEPWFEKAYTDHGLWIWPNFVPADYMFDRIEEPIIGTRSESNATEIIAPDLQPEFIGAIKKYNEWYKKGWINPDLTSESSGDSEFKTGKYFGITYQLKPGKADELVGTIGYDLVQVEMNTPEIANSETSGAMVAIPAASDNKDEAMDFLNLLYTDKNLINILVWGEEGVDWNFTDQGKGIIEKVADSGYAWSQGWTMGNQFNNYLLSNEDPDKWQKFLDFNAAGHPLPALGFVPDTSDMDMQTAIAGMRAARENFADLFRGYVDDVDGEFAKLQEQYKAAGMDDLIAKYQTQFDAWRASK